MCGDIYNLNFSTERPFRVSICHAFNAYCNHAVQIWGSILTLQLSVWEFLVTHFRYSTTWNTQGLWAYNPCYKLWVRGCSVTLCISYAWDQLENCVFTQLVRGSTLWHHNKSLLSNPFLLRVIQYSSKGMNCCMSMATMVVWICRSVTLYVHCVPCFSLMDANIFHKHKSVYSSLCSFFHPSAISVALGPYILHSKCSPTPSICVFPLGEGSHSFTNARQWVKSWYCVLFNWCVFTYLVHMLFSFWGCMLRLMFWLTDYRVLLCFSWCLYVFHKINVISVDQKLVCSNNFGQH